MTDTTTISHDPTCTQCVHECPWRNHHFGAPWCATCDDHAEAQHAGYGADPCDCGDHAEYVSVWASELRSEARFLFN